MKQDTMRLKYASPAPELREFVEDAFKNNSWELYSLPIGNGYFGGSVFGRTVTERIQISELTLFNPWIKRPTTGRCVGGVNSFAEILIDVGHKEYSEYERSLSLDDACTYVTYRHDGVTYRRAAFASYPDKVIAVRFEADVPASVTLGIKLIVPFVGNGLEVDGDGYGKSGNVTVEGNKLVMRGEMEYFGTKFMGILQVVNHGGKLISENASIKVENADDVVLLFTCDTSYELCPQVFYEDAPKKKLEGKTLDENKVYETVGRASELSFDELFMRHLEDYRSLYSRVTLKLGWTDDRYTDEILENYPRGIYSPYLETLLYQYGRYMMIASSRSRLPASLQGIWNAYSQPHWSCGFWHNINIQMNYWHVGASNLADCFGAYINYSKAYIDVAKRNADRFIQEKYPEKYTEDGTNGWMIGTSASAYHISYFKGGGHTGPGSGALTALMFWDYFDYTRDMEFLRDWGYPMLRGMSVVFEKTLVEQGGKYLVQQSASPENGLKDGKFYQTVGCAFDQQMVYENFKRTIEAAEILGENDPLIEKLKIMLPNLDPVLIGDDGQVKEYREETYYSSIGDPNHRHISHLLGMYPGTVINANTPEWIKAAQITLEKRGDRSTGWGTMQRLLLWARIKAKHKCRDLMDMFISYMLNDNLWDLHPPFQIDANFGYVAAVGEMLLQSHSGYIELLPVLLPQWRTGEFEGIVARGNFVVDCSWENEVIKTVIVTARAGGCLKIKLPEHIIPNGAVVENGVFVKEMAVGETISFNS